MLRRKTKRIIAWVLIVLFTLSLLTGFVLAILPPNTEKVEENVTEEEPVKLVINTTPPSTHGELIIRAEDTNEVIYNYEGNNINIIKTGRRGEDVLVEIHMPKEDMCSCFSKEEGR